ncbi:hypothetical protein [Desulfosarcina ovata]|uniref:hypothetical protein n=1 Tax=Desulfosarcina ovata TaxID=83564 RepID=UPI0012D2EDFF|nr:hypothetical protein [Desulfosarcina ovata]
MLSELHQKSSFYFLLNQIDTNLSEQYQEMGCPDCDGPLHKAYYDRKPRGGPDLPEELCIRKSLCCGNRDCRHRLLPPSCLFMGRRVYWGLVILLIMTIRQNRPEGKNTKRLIDQFGIDRKTFFRWVIYYRDAFPSSVCWRGMRGCFSATVSNSCLPGDALDAFIAHAGDSEAGLTNCLKLFSKGQFFQHYQGRKGITQKMGLRSGF